jgi:DNA-directed RNA polymerase subunit RPC12/RpoP
MTNRVDPWHRFRALKRATIFGVSLFFLMSAPLVLERVAMRTRPVYLLAVYLELAGWAIFVLVMITLTHEIRCPRCGQRFYVKGTVFWQVATKCLRCGQKKYGDVGTAKASLVNE